MSRHLQLDLAEIFLSQGESTIVDWEDYDELNRFKWYCRNGYAARAVGPAGHQQFIYMHNLIMRVKEGGIVDHIDRDPLNNMRENLRVVSLDLQNFNRAFRKRKHPRGVRLANPGRSKTNRYVASISIQGKRIYLGTFGTPEEASDVYREACWQHYGEYPADNA